MMKLKGKVAVIAGASGGIGREISLALASEGVEVILVARRKLVLNALKQIIEEKGGKANVYTCDLSSSKSIVAFSREIKSKFGSIDLLFHVAGIGVYKCLEDIKLEEWEKSLSVDVTSVFYLTQKLLPLLKKSKKSCVLAMGSGMGKIALSGRSVYCTSKFALRGLMLTLAKEFKKTNIKFSLITLGSTLTSFGPLTLEEKREKQKEGKKYLDPQWLAKHIVRKIKNGTLDDEVSIYPRHYFEESKEDKR